MKREKKILMIILNLKVNTILKFKINLDKDDNIIFEDEYLNGKLWNGKGYEKNNNNLLFELKEGNGIIKKYFENGNLLYEAEYKNGEINGKLK